MIGSNYPGAALSAKRMAEVIFEFFAADRMLRAGLTLGAYGLRGNFKRAATYTLRLKKTRQL